MVVEVVVVVVVVVVEVLVEVVVMVVVAVVVKVVVEKVVEIADVVAEVTVSVDELKVVAKVSSGKTLLEIISGGSVFNIFAVGFSTKVVDSSTSLNLAGVVASTTVVSLLLPECNQ